SGEDDSSSRFFKAARTVPSNRVRSLSPALRAATCSARRVSRRSGIDATAAVLPLGGVHLALLLLARLLVVAMLAEIRKDAGLLALLLEALERALEALVIVEDDLGHLLTHPSRAPVRGRQMKNNPEVYGFLSSIGRARVIGRRGGARVLRAGRAGRAPPLPFTPNPAARSAHSPRVAHATWHRRRTGRTRLHHFPICRLSTWSTQAVCRLAKRPGAGRGDRLDSPVPARRCG